MRLLALILSVIQMSRVHSQEPQWPVHSICSSERLSVIYRSCDPLQDIALTLLPCPNTIRDPVTLRLALILRQPIREFYSSIQLFLNGNLMLSRDEPLCLTHFPRFTFCGSRRGELITVESSFKSKMDNALKGHFNLMLRGINQDGFQIVCVNATFNFQ